MTLFDIVLPELKFENVEEIVKICRDIHQDRVNGRVRNTKIQQWDKYWVNAYNLVLSVLERNKNGEI